MSKITGNEPINAMFYGLTIRQHFAAMANPDEESFSVESIKAIMGVDELPTDKLENIKFWDSFNAKRKVMLADALIAELNKQITNESATI